MRVNYNNEYFKIPKSEIPKTFQEFTQITLPEVLAPEPLPSRFTLCYFDIESYPIKVKNERNYQAMCQEMEKFQHDLKLSLTSEQQEKLVQNMSNILSSMYDARSTESFPPESLFIQNSTAQSVKQEVIPVIIKLEEEEDELKVFVDVENNKEKEMKTQPSQNSFFQSPSTQSTKQESISALKLEEEVLMEVENDKETNSTEIYTHEDVRKELSERINRMLSSEIAQSTQSSFLESPSTQLPKQEAIPILKLEEEELKVPVEDGNDKEINYTEIYFTHKNVEWIVNEPDALRRGLSERIKKNNEKKKKEKSPKSPKNSEKKKSKERKTRKRSSRIPKLENELKDLEREQKVFLDFLDKCAEREQEKVEHKKAKLEDIVEKKLQTSPIREMSVKQEESKPIEKRKNSDDDKTPINPLESHYRVGIDFGKDFLEVTAKQEATKSRLKSEKDLVFQSNEKRPNTTVTDGNIKSLIKALLEALKSEGHNSLNIENLTLNFKNCRNLSKYGISYLFQAINDEFKNVITLNLDFSFSKRQSSLKTSHLLSKIALDLHRLENLSLNLSNRCDLTKEETNMIIESLEKNSKDSLKSLNLFLPTMFFVGPETKNNLKTELNFIENLNVFPVL